MAEPGHAFGADFDPCHPLAIGVGAVGAAVVHQHPPAALRPEHGMVPGDAIIGEHDVALWIPAGQIRAVARQTPVMPLDPDHQRWRGRPGAGLFGIHLPTLGRFKPGK